MISLTPISPLNLHEASQKNRLLHLSAASGLIQQGARLYVIADDENHLAVFPAAGSPGTLTRLLPGELPLPLEERKAATADFEVLVQLPISKHHPYGALMALGSGSKETRRRGVIISFDEHNDFAETIVIDLSKLYGKLKNEIGNVNFEGAVVIGKHIFLFQRGNKKNKLNASIRLSLKHFFAWVFNDQKNDELEFNIKAYDLGEIKGVPLCFTDATALPDGTILFTAAAENTSDAYADGLCMGSVIGIIDADGDLHSLHTVDKNVKAEGIEASVINDTIHLLIVTDADDETAPAQLYAAELSGYSFKTKKSETKDNSRS